jgi:single-strand DNA-binding protein
MASLNKVFLMGNLTRETALRFTPGGAAVCEFGIAVNRRFVSNGQEKDETCFVDIVVWGKQAESCDRFLEKGSPVLVEGRLQYDQWEDRESGGKRSRLRVVAERVQFMSRGGAEGGAQQSQGNSQAPSYNQNYNRQNQQQYSQQKSYAPQSGNYQGSQQQRAPQPPQQQQDEYPPPPPMPEDAFQVDDEMEDDIPF